MSILRPPKGNRAAPLEGLLVCDLSRLLPGPYATRILADLGARVVKVEEPGLGDYARVILPEVAPPDGSAPVGHAFAAFNRGKESIAVNLKTPEGVEIVRRLAARADVFIESFRPGVADRLGVGYDAVSATNPGLVYVALSGYGATGPMREAPGHDLNYAALAGILAIQGRDDRAPPVPGVVPVADVTGGHYAVIGILAALLDRTRSGKGRFLDIALADAAREANALHLTRALAQDVRRGRVELAGAVPSYDVHACADGGFVALGCLEPKFWELFCAAVERPDLASRHLDPDARADVEAIFQADTRDAWVARLAPRGIPITPVLSPREALRDEQAAARPPTPIGGASAMPLPGLGEHTSRVLAELGYSDERVAELRAAKVIG